LTRERFNIDKTETEKSRRAVLRPAEGSGYEEKNRQQEDQNDEKSSCLCSGGDFPADRLRHGES
jgi:hypothetical protein